MTSPKFEPTFEPLRIEPTYRRVATTIAARIMNRSLAAGESLPSETSLATQLGVNRSTVREALRELESGGLIGRRKGTKRLVVVRPATGIVAERITNALALQDVTVAEVWETLMMLEPPAAEAAALRASPEHLAALRDASAHYAAVCGDTNAAVEAVSAFFRAIVAGTENRALALAHEPALRLLQSSLGLLIDRIPQARERIRTAQRRLVMTIEAKDGVAAREWMDKHIRDFRRGLEVAGIDLSYRVSI